MVAKNEDIFIDADATVGSEKDSYDSIIIKQILKCTEVLSRDMTPGQQIVSDDKKQSYIEDVNELVINHVDTLRILLSPFTRDEFLISLNLIDNDIENKKLEMGSREIIVPGRGYMRLIDIKSISINSMHWKEYLDFKAKKHREIFEILVKAYNKQRSIIKSLESE